MGWRILENLARLLMEWAERQQLEEGRSIVDSMDRAWMSPRLNPPRLNPPAPTPKT